ncbi:MAG: hypothetical protein IPK26_00555 [Planctomycetes bacterium]|nr:hypothetical protein [Planctomycetota bacterium]
MFAAARLKPSLLPCSAPPQKYLHQVIRNAETRLSQSAQSAVEVEELRFVCLVQDVEQANDFQASPLREFSAITFIDEDEVCPEFFRKCNGRILASIEIQLRVDTLRCPDRKPLRRREREPADGSRRLGITASPSSSITAVGTQTSSKSRGRTSIR